MNVYKFLILGVLLCVFHDSASAMKRKKRKLESLSENKESSLSQGSDIKALDDFEKGYLFLSENWEMFEGLNDDDSGETLVKLCLKKLLEMRDEKGNSFLHHAVKNNDIKFVKGCIRMGLRIDARNDEGKMPLDLANEAGHVEVRDLLQINLNLLASAYNGNFDGVQKALDAGACPNVRDVFTYTPLLWAAQINSKIAQFLIDRGACVNSKGFSGHTPLIMAMRLGLGSEALVEKLLVAGAYIDCVDSENRTPLWWAACNGHLEVVRQLLAAEADTTIRDTVFQDTALDIARKNEHAEIVALLEDHQRRKLVTNK